jgi:RES domain
VRRSPKNVRIAFNHTGLTHFGGIHLLHEFTRVLALIKIRESCLDLDDLTRSQQLGQALLAVGVQGLLFPSVVATGRNLIVYLENCRPSSLTLHNADQMKDRIAEIAKLAKP